MPEEDKQKIKETTEELNKFKDLDILSESNGGKILIENLLKDILSTIEVIANGYNTLSHNEFIAKSAYLKVQIDILRSLKRAKKNAKFLDEELKKLLVE